jgi:hypothetical protein
MKRFIPLFARISFLTLALSAILYAASIRWVGVADKVNSTFSVWLRRVLADLTAWLPFSFFELLVILSPFLLVFILVMLLRRGKNMRKRIRALISIIAVISLILTSYIYTLGIGYHTTPVSEKIGIEDRADISTEELYRTVLILVDEVNALAPTLDFKDGETRMPCSVDELSERLVGAYDNLLRNYPILTNYPSRVKPVHFSTVMSDLGITGIYSFFTGEANVNVEYPDYSLPFTAAHEMAHQRGICRENEANFVAFLTTIASDDVYVRYSGYLSAYEYLASALYSADPELYFVARDQLHEYARRDMIASNAVYNKHKDSILGKINDRLNDAYLKANGTDGVVSYGYVTRLIVEYYSAAEPQ